MFLMELTVLLEGLGDFLFVLIPQSLIAIRLIFTGFVYRQHHVSTDWHSCSHALKGGV